VTSQVVDVQRAANVSSCVASTSAHDAPDVAREAGGDRELARLAGDGAADASRRSGSTPSAATSDSVRVRCSPVSERRSIAAASSYGR
jgi:hypothetical protein